MEVVVRRPPGIKKAGPPNDHIPLPNYLDVLNLDADPSCGSDVRCLLTELRSELTDCPAYRSMLTQFYESFIFPEFLRTLNKRDIIIRTAMGLDYLGKVYEECNILALEIPRAGTLPTDLFIDRIQKLPGPIRNINVAKAVIDIKRKEGAGKPLEHIVNYCNLPEIGARVRIAICDQMLATGKTTAKAISILQQSYGERIENLFVGSVVGVPQGIETIRDIVNRYKIKTELVIGAIDSGLDEKSYILPGLGDAGDRVSGVWRPTL
jgi:uracil phosphoribosyltransferase